MLEHIAIGGNGIIGIIGEGPGVSSPLLGGVLGTVGMVRAPEFLPESFNGFLFETQWVYWIVCLSVAATLVYVGRSRAEKQYVRAGYVALGLVAVWIVAAWAVDTSRERLYRAHQGLAAAAKAADMDRILSYLATDFQSPALGVEKADLAREEIETRLKTYGIRASTITAYRSDLSGRAAFTTLTLITETEMAGPVPTTWHLSWDDVPTEDWKMKEADLVKLGDEAVSAERLIPK